MSASPIEVLVDDRTAGLLTLIRRPGHQRDCLAFSYTDSWLRDPSAFELSPDLPLTGGHHTPRVSRTIFSAFQDALPDAWGRRVMTAVRPSGARFSTVQEIELLLTVPDDIRQGALRFRRSGTMLGAASEGQALRRLPDLVAAAERLQSEGAVSENDRRLLEAGTSAGGAHPKAWVEEAGTLWLAKFPPGVPRWQGGPRPSALRNSRCGGPRHVRPSRVQRARRQCG